MSRVDPERVVAMLRLPAPAAGVEAAVDALEVLYGEGLRMDFEGTWMRIFIPEVKKEVPAP